MNNSSLTGFSTDSAKFDTTGLENPFYENTSKGDSLIEQMKNNILIVDEVEIESFITEFKKPEEEDN